MIESTTNHFLQFFNIPQNEDPIFKHPFNFAFYSLSWILLQLPGNCLLVTMIRTLRNNQYATLPNKLTCFYYETVIILSNLIIVNIDFLRAIFGPLPTYLCLVNNLCMRSAALITSFTIIEVSVLKLLYVTVWKNMGVLNDDFFECFFKVANISLAIYHSLLVLFTGGYEDIHFMVCVQAFPKNLDPDRTFLINPKISSYLIFLALFVIGSSSLAIWRKGKDKYSHWSQAQHNQVNARENVKLFLFFGVSFMLVLVPLVLTVTNVPMDQLVVYPYSTLFLVTKIIFPVMPSIIMPVMTILFDKKYWALFKRNCISRRMLQMI